MKILLVHPGFSWASGEISHHIEETLYCMGHEVATFDPLPFVQLFRPTTTHWSEVGLKASSDHLFLLASERLPLRAIEERPDLVLVVHGGRLSPHVVDAIRMLGIQSAVWLLDDPHEIDRSTQYARHYDWVFTTERAAVEAHKARGCRNVFHIPLGCHPPVQKPMEVDERYKSDVCLVGSGFPERVRLLSEIADSLAGLRLKLVGPWQNLPKNSPLRGSVVEGVVSAEEAAKYCAGAKIVLNPHRDADGLSLGSNLWKVPAVSPNPRLFEAAACGTLVLTDDRRADSGQYFVPGEEIGTYSNGAELVEQIHYWLGNESLRSAAAAAASQRAHREHSLRERLKTLLGVIDRGLQESSSPGAQGELHECRIGRN